MEEMSELVLVGGGGHASVINEAACAANWQVVGYFDDQNRMLSSPSSPHGNTVTLPTVPRLGRFRDFLQPDADIDAAIILAIGCLTTRRRLIDLYRGRIGSVIHPAAMVSESSKISEGSFVATAAILNPFSDIGRHVIVNTRAIVEHHCQVEENSHIAPGAILGGGVFVGANSFVGLAASINPNVRIGRNCIVGAGAVVTHDVADGTTVVGVPAKPIELRKSA